jgi:hypothetical protein
MTTMTGEIEGAVILKADRIRPAKAILRECGGSGNMAAWIQFDLAEEVDVVGPTQIKLV